MIKKISLAVLLLIVFCHSHGQHQGKKIKLGSVTTAGLLNGSYGTSSSLQTIIGAGYKRSFLGLGAGLDYYRFRSIPLFVDARHDFGKGRRNIFLYGDLGYNYDWVVKGEPSEMSFPGPSTSYKGGVYYDAGFGYKFGFARSEALLISAGYSFKKMQVITGSGVCPLIGPCFDAIQKYDYYLPRLVLRAGWRF